MARRKVQSTRMLKVQCGACAYTARVSRKWLADAGAPLCPCNGQPMESPEWDDQAAAYPGPCNERDPLAAADDWAAVADLVDARQEIEREAADRDARRQTAAVVRDMQVTARQDHECEHCRGVIHRGETHRTVALRHAGGEMETVRTCAGCMQGARGAGVWEPWRGQGFAPDGTQG